MWRYELRAYPPAGTPGQSLFCAQILLPLHANTAYGAKAGQIDGQSLHTIEETSSHDGENDEQYVVCDGPGHSLIRQG